MKQKVLSSLLSLLLISCTLLSVACADGNSTSGSSDSQSDYDLGGSDLEQSKQIDPEILELNFEQDGEPTELVFAFSESSDEHFTLRSISPDEDSEDAVDSMIVKRNSIINDTLGVKITAYQASSDIQGLQNAINAQMAGQDPEIDVIVGYQYYDIDIATQGWICNLADMRDEDNNKIDYIHYDSKEYWGGAYIDALSYKNIVYWITGDLSLRYIGGEYCTYINKRLYDQYLADKYGNVYDIVRRNEWTMEMLYTMADEIYLDNGNEKVDSADVLGYAWEPNDPIDGLAFGCQVPFSTKSANNDSVTLTLNNVRSMTFVTELEKLLYGRHSLNVGDMASTIVMPIFESGTVGFTVNKLFQAEKYLTKMKDDYMIVPVPMLNKDQKNYTTGIHDGCSIYGISYFSDSKEAAAATLEYMAYLSHRDVRPIYYDQALKNKYTTDQASAEMIDLIHKNVNTDFAAAWSESIENIVHWFRTHNKTSRFASELKRYSSAQNTALEKLLKNLETYATESP